MTREELLKAIGNIDDDLILRAREDRKKKPKIWVAAGTVAACLVIAVAALPYMQSKTAKDTASMETTTATGSTSSAASAEWFDGEADLEDGSGCVCDDGGEEIIGSAPASAKDCDGANAAPELKANYRLFTVNEVRYRIVTEEEELKALGLTKTPSEEIAGELIGEVSLFEDGCGNAYAYMADVAGIPAEVYKNSISLEDIYLFNHGENWYYAVEDTP